MQPCLKVPPTVPKCYSEQETYYRVCFRKIWKENDEDKQTTDAKQLISNVGLALIGLEKII